MPLPAVHDLPVEPPTGPAPRSPLRALLVAIGAFVLVLAALWVIDRFDGPSPSSASLDTTVTEVSCPPATRAHARCFVGAARNLGAEPVSLLCAWSGGGRTVSFDAGPIPVQRIASGAVLRTDVVALVGGRRPTLHCVSV